MSVLPDELWFRILELGAGTSRLDYRDLCSIAISCRRLSQLSSDPALWSILLALDFPQSSSSPSTLPPKSAYKIRFERDKSRKVMLWRRAVLNVESHVAVSEKRLRDLESLMVKEMERLKTVGDELSNLERARTKDNRVDSIPLPAHNKEKGHRKKRVKFLEVPVRPFCVGP